MIILNGLHSSSGLDTLVDGSPGALYAKNLSLVLAKAALDASLMSRFSVFKFRRLTQGIG